MTWHQVRRLTAPQGFVPFAMHIADGRVIEIEHPELVLVTAGGRIAIVRHRDGTDEVVDILMITSLRPLAST